MSMIERYHPLSKLLRDAIRESPDIGTLACRLNTAEQVVGFYRRIHPDAGELHLGDFVDTGFLPSWGPRPEFPETGFYAWDTRDHPGLVLHVYGPLEAPWKVFSIPTIVGAYNGSPDGCGGTIFRHQAVFSRAEVNKRIGLTGKEISGGLKKYADHIWNTVTALCRERGWWWLRSSIGIDDAFVVVVGKMPEGGEAAVASMLADAVYGRAAPLRTGPRARNGNDFIYGGGK